MLSSATTKYHQIGICDARSVDGVDAHEKKLRHIDDFAKKKKKESHDFVCVRETNTRTTIINF